MKTIELEKIKPDIRMFEFNKPSQQGSEAYGYKFWMTIPEDLEISITQSIL